MNCYFFTFGCKVNACDTAGMAELLRQNGHTICQNFEEASIVVLNSCSVTEAGDNSVRTTARRIRKKNPDCKIILTGCFARALPEQAREIAEIDYVYTPHSYQQFVELINAVTAEKEIVFDNSPCSAFEMLPNAQNAHNTRSFLKIQDGCNCFCTYCIIPFARGRCRSMPREQITRQVQELVQQGYQETVLCGINLGFYGMEWDLTLADAVEAAASGGISRIRLSSLEPERLTTEVIAQLAKIPALCPQFHLSLQSGCDNVLQRMHRRYTTEEYYQLITRLREVFPNCAITTDFMVGFPGETEEEFQESLEFLQKCAFAGVHVFRYSPRPGTKAAGYPDQIPDNVKTQRYNRTKAVTSRTAELFHKSMIGQRVQVLFEREKGDGWHIGHAPNGTLIRVSQKNQKKCLRNRMFCVIIEESDAECCYGSFCDDTANS